MEYDVFFSISQTPVDGHMPSESEMFTNFFEEVVAADGLGFNTAWIAESHFSTEVQKQHRHPVVPHWQGEVGLNTDFLQLSREVFAKTRRIETGSAVMNILVNGGPIAAAERIAAFLTFHGLDPEERRRIHVGFASGRFDFMSRTTGIVPRNAVEEASWPALKGKIFAEATEIFLRLIRGDVLNSEQVRETTLSRADFRSDADWERVVAAASAEGIGDGIVIPIARRFTFEDVMIVPKDYRRDLITLIAGTHDPALQEDFNRYLPVQVFNLSITSPEIIDDTHRRMEAHYHQLGGPWKRAYMPRTVMVFLNEEPGLTPEARRDAARGEANAALSEYWKALQGTIDPKKVENAADNALIGNAGDVATQIIERYHPEDRLMLWFDFFNHDAGRVIRNMEAFMEKVRPLVAEGHAR